MQIVEKEIALASIEKKVKEYDLKEFSFLITGLIHKIHAECGQKEDMENIDLTIDLLIKDLREYNKNISYQEIELAFRNGFKNEYGEWFGLNNKTYFQWVNGYTQSVKRRNAIKAREDLLLPKVVELTEEEKKGIIHEGALLCFKQFKDKGEVMDMGNVTYNYLDSIGIFKWAKGRKFDFLNKAQQILKLENQNLLQACKDSIQRIELKKSLEEINNAQSTPVKSMAKRIALNAYFKDLIEMEMELQTELEENNNK